MFRRLRTLKKDLRATACDIDPDRLTVDQAADAIKEAAEIEKIAAGLRLRLAHRIDNMSLFGQDGERSAAEWLAKTTGQSTTDAQRDLECSRRLRALPDADDAVRNGELSPDQAKAVADGATADPAAEKELLDTARKGSFGELNRKAKARKAAALGDDEARARAAHRNRSFTTGTNALGEGWGRFNGPAHLVARLNAQLKPFLDQVFAQARREGRRERPDAYAFDAFMAFAGLLDLEDLAGGASAEDGGTRPTNEARAARPTPPSDAGDAGAETSHGALDPSGGATRRNGTPRRGAPAPGGPAQPTEPTAARAESTLDLWPGSRNAPDRRTDASAATNPEPAGSAATTGHDPPPGRTTGPPPSGPPALTAPARRPTVRPDTRLILRVDASALRRGHTVAGETCDIAGLGPISVADLRALLPDAAIDLVVTNGVDVFNVTHLSRRANARQQVVLDLLNIGCTREGCNATQHLQVDHRIDWHKIKVTELVNLDWLCPHCHRLKTHDGWQLEPGTGKRPMRPPGRQPWLEAGGDPAAGPPPHAA